MCAFSARRVTDLLPIQQLKFSCFDSRLGYQRLPVHNVTVPSYLLFGRVPHNAAHVICFCLPPTIVWWTLSLRLKRTTTVRV